MRLVFLSLTAIAVAGNASARQPAPDRCQGSLAERLHKSALAAPDEAQDDGKLYGMQRWRGATKQSHFGLKFPGLLSCAYTVSAIFRGACHSIGERASVKSIDAALADWKKVTDPTRLEPGDVVFWKPVRGTILGIQCPGHWHIGISIGGGETVDNDWWSGMPKKSTLDRKCTAFAYARRPPG